MPWLSLIAFSSIAVSLLLTVLALVRRSALALALAAAGSAVFSALAILSIGPFTALLPCRQLAGAAAIRLSARKPLGVGLLVWIASLLAGLLTWFALIGRVLLGLRE